MDRREKAMQERAMVHAPASCLRDKSQALSSSACVGNIAASRPFHLPLPKHLVVTTQVVLFENLQLSSLLVDLVDVFLVSIKLSLFLSQQSAIEKMN